MHHLADLFDGTRRQKLGARPAKRGGHRGGLLQLLDEAVNNTPVDVLDIVLTQQRIDIVVDKACVPRKSGKPPSLCPIEVNKVFQEVFDRYR